MSSVAFRPLYGTGEHDPLSFLLEIDECVLLLDCGWTRDFDTDLLEPLAAEVDRIDAVLISHSSFSHCGALPYLVSKLGLSAPIYVTLPVWRMGQLVLAEIFQELRELAPPPFSIADIRKAFSASHMHPLSNAQEVHLAGTDGITLQPHRAGHTLGGAVWRIAKDTEVIVYAVDFNRRNEQHLQQTLIEAFQRPSVLITNGATALRPSLKRKQRDQGFFTNIEQYLQAHGTIMIPVDTAGRVLEMLYILNALWTERGYRYPLIWLAHEAARVRHHAQGLTEWMSKKCQEYAEAFDLPHVRVVKKVSDVTAIQGPKLVLATNEVMSTGLSQELFLRMVAHENNLVLLTSIPPPESLARQVLNRTAILQIKHLERVQLEGTELAEYLEAKRAEKEQQMAPTASAESGTDSSDDEDMDDESSSDDEEMASAAEQTVPQTARRRRGRGFSALHPMYPFAEKRRRFDDWGEFVDTAAFAKVAEELERASTAGLPAHLRQRHQKSQGTIPSAMDMGVSTPLNDDPLFGLDADDSSADATPMKTVTRSLTVEVRCRSGFFDFEGRTDGKTLQRVIQSMQPRKLVIVGGSDDAKSELRRVCVEKKFCNEVYVPQQNQQLNLTSDTNIFRISLSDELANNARFVKISRPDGDFQVAYVTGQLTVDYKESRLPILEPQEADNDEDDEDVALHPSVFLGTTMMREVQRILRENDIAAQFVGGVLVCNQGVVNIRKVSPTQLSVRGALSEDYFKIRRLLFGLYSLV